MSDSLNSPDLSSEYPQELTPETDVLVVNNQSVMASSTHNSAVADFESSLGDLEVIDSSKELSPEEEASFEVIADYIEAEIAIEEAIATQTVEAEAREFAEGAATFGNLEKSGGEAMEAEAAASEAVNEAVDDAEAVEAEGLTEAGMLQESTAEVCASETAMTESFDASIEVVDVEILESQEQEQSYEVHQDGTLTYFQYFLDEEDSAFGPGYGEWRNEANSSPRSFVSATAVGVGVLAATFGAGLLMAEATNRNSISDGDSGSFETQAKAEAERTDAGESAGLAKASGPEAATPDWSATQKALAVSEGSANANPALGSAAASPATSGATSKLAPLAQAWGAPIPLPPALPTASPAVAASSVASLPIAPPPAAATASLPTPTTVPTSLAALRPIPSYQVVQPASSGVAASAAARLPSPPAIETPRPDEQQLRARMEALRDRMAEPIPPDTVPVAVDGNLLDGPDERWVGNVPSQVNVPIENGETSVDSAFAPRELPTLADSLYGAATTVISSPAAVPPSAALADGDTSPGSIDISPSNSIATAPQAYPLDLSPIVSPAQAPLLDEKIVAPVAGLVPTRLMPQESEPGELPPQALAAPAQRSDRDPAVQMKASARSQDSVAETVNARQAAQAQARGFRPSVKQASLEVTPGAIALEVIPPKVSTPSLTASVPEQAMGFQNVSLRRTASPSAVQKNIRRDVNSLMELANRQSVHPLALSRDTALAALENAEQLDQFRVLPLTVQEYQRLWQESGNRDSFAPMHGFVDYGQNVIAVLVARVVANSETSALSPGAEEFRTGSAVEG